MSQSASKIPRWVWITTPTLALAFVGFILFLSTLPKDSELGAVKGEAQKILQESLRQAKEKAVETVSKPNYQFYKLLENQTVDVPDVDVYKSTPKDADVEYEYRLQAGSFRSLDDAERLRSQLLLQNLPAYRQESNINGVLWHRVYVGPYTNRSKMNKAQDILADNNISPLVHKSTHSSQ